MYSIINYPIYYPIKMKITNILETTIDVSFFKSKMTQGMYITFPEYTVLSIIWVLISK